MRRLLVMIAAFADFQASEGKMSDSSLIRPDSSLKMVNLVQFYKSGRK